MKRSSEADFGRALRAVDDSVPTYVYRLPDPKAGGGVSNWKPCDFMAFSLGDVRHGAVSIQIEKAGTFDFVPTLDVAWFECKDTPALNAFPFADIRDSQWQGIREAKRIGIPYWLAVYWRRHREWTISDAVKLELARPGFGTSIERRLLMSRFGISSSPRDLTSTLKSILAGEV